jgi:hypothetical protein
MKKYQILFLLNMLFLTNSFAQASQLLPLTNSNRIVSKIEVLLGPSLVSVRESDQYDKYGERKISYVLGLGVTQTLNTNWSINYKLLYERKGFKQQTIAFIPPDYYDNPPTTNLPPVKTKITGDLNNNYISLVLLPEFCFGKQNKIHLGAGPYISKLLNSFITTTDTQNGTVMRSQTIAQNETYKNYDYGLSSIIAYDFFQIKNIEFSVQLYYNYGLVNITEMKQGVSPTENNSLALVFAFGLLR